MVNHDRSSLTAQDRLRALALGDARTMRNIVEIDRDAVGTSLPAPCRAFVDLAALVAVGAGEVPYGAAVERAFAGGASGADLAGVLLCLVPIIGFGRGRDAAETLVRVLGTEAEAQRAFVLRVSAAPLRLYVPSA